MVNGAEANHEQQPPADSAAAFHHNGSTARPPNGVLVRSPTPIGFRKAVKRDAKLRLAISGPSGSGKTYTLLKLASELGGPIAMVDTEHGSASKYADLFEFDVLELDSYDPETLLKIIDRAADIGFRVICIDSLSHFWMGKDGELEKVDHAARKMQNPNSFAAWKQVTPIHNALIDKIIGCPIHVLASMRTKTEWVLDRDERTGKTVPRKVGLAPVMRDGIEYEFDVCGEMDHENVLQITKARCPELSGGIFPKPGKDIADLLKVWLSGTAAESPTQQVTTPVVPPRKAAQLPAKDGGPTESPAHDGLAEELVSIWRQMCSPRGVNREFEQLKFKIEQLAGSGGVAEYLRILAQHGVRHPRGFRAAQPARLCAKQMFAFLEELRAKVADNSLPPDPAASAPRSAPKNSTETR